MGCDKDAAFIRPVILPHIQTEYRTLVERFQSQEPIGSGIK